jgi:uncharacterized protein YoxC
MSGVDGFGINIAQLELNMQTEEMDVNQLRGRFLELQGNIEATFQTIDSCRDDEKGKTLKRQINPHLQYVVGQIQLLKQVIVKVNKLKVDTARREHNITHSKNCCCCNYRSAVNAAAYGSMALCGAGMFALGFFQYKKDGEEVDKGIAAMAIGGVMTCVVTPIKRFLEKKKDEVAQRLLECQLEKTAAVKLSNTVIGQYQDNLSELKRVCRTLDYQENEGEEDTVQKVQDVWDGVPKKRRLDNLTNQVVTNIADRKRMQREAVGQEMALRRVECEMTRPMQAVERKKDEDYLRSLIGNMDYLTREIEGRNSDIIALTKETDFITEKLKQLDHGIEGKSKTLDERADYLSIIEKGFLDFEQKRLIVEKEIEEEKSQKGYLSEKTSEKQRALIAENKNRSIEKIEIEGEIEMFFRELNAMEAESSAFRERRTDIDDQIGRIHNEKNSKESEKEKLAELIAKQEETIRENDRSRASLDELEIAPRRGGAKPSQPDIELLKLHQLAGEVDGLTDDIDKIHDETEEADNNICSGELVHVNKQREKRDRPKKSLWARVFK